MMKRKLFGNVIGRQELMNIIIVLGYFCFLLIWSLNQPFGNGPEEKLRYAIPEYINDNLRLPSLFDKELYDSYYGTSYAGQPFFPYIMCAFFMRIESFLFGNSGNLLMAARMVSVLCGVGFAIFIIKVANELFENNYVKYFFVFFVICWRYTSYLFTYVNCDSMMMLGCAITVCYVSKGVKSRWPLKTCIGTSLGISLILLSYINGIGYVLFALIAFISSYFVYYKKNIEMFKKGVLVTSLIFLMSGWFYIRNLILYGSLFGGNIANQVVKASSSANTSLITLIHKNGNAFTLILQWIKGQIYSFCGVFYKDDPWIIKICAAAILLLCLGLLTMCILSKSSFLANGKVERVISCSLNTALVVTILLDLYYSTFVCYIPYYARYLVPGIIVVGYYISIYAENKIENNKSIVIALTLLLGLVSVQDIVSAIIGI